MLQIQDGDMEFWRIYKKMPLQGNFLEDTGRLRQCHGDSFYLDLVVVKAVSSGQLIPDLVVFKASCGGPPFVSLSEKSNTEVIQTQDGDMEFGRYTRIRWLT